MLDYETAIELLELIRLDAQRGYIPLSAKEVEALNMGIGAIKSLQDLPSVITDLLDERRNEE